MTMQTMISNSNVDSFQRRGQRNITNKTTKTFHVIIKTQRFDHHRRALSYRRTIWLERERRRKSKERRYPTFVDNANNAVCRSPSARLIDRSPRSTDFHRNARVSFAVVIFEPCRSAESSLSSSPTTKTKDSESNVEGTETTDVEACTARDSEELSRSDSRPARSRDSTARDRDNFVSKSIFSASRPVASDAKIRTPDPVAADPFAVRRTNEPERSAIRRAIFSTLKHSKLSARRKTKTILRKLMITCVDVEPFSGEAGR